MTLKLVDFANETDAEAREAMLHVTRQVIATIESGEAVSLSVAVVTKDRMWTLGGAGHSWYGAEMSCAVRALDARMFHDIADVSLGEDE